MPEKNSMEADAEEKQTVLDRLNTAVDSPFRLFIFCVALLLLSLTAGMLIGTAVKDDPAPKLIAAVHPARPELTLSDDGDRKSQKTAPLHLGEARPVDALSDDNPYRVPRDYGDNDAPKDTEGAESEETVAALPPPSPPSSPEAKSDLPPWKRYAALSAPSEGRPMIAMVIDDVGHSKKSVKNLVELPGILTLAFLPYVRDLKESVKMTRQKGHEVMLHIPMEPLGASVDPGPDALLKSLSLDEIRKVTLKNLSQFSGYVGVNNHMGSKFTSYEEGMAAVMDILREKGLLFLDSRTTSTSMGYKLAKERDMPAASRDVFIDNVINEAAILKQLKIVEAVALKKGIAIAIGHPHKETIAALRKWMPEAAQKGFHFIPVSAALSSGQ